MSIRTVAHDPSVPFGFAQGRRFADTSPSKTMGRQTQSRGLRRTMQLPPAAINFAHSAFAACRLSSETRTRNGTPARRRPSRTSGRRSPRTALYLRRSRS